MDPPEKHTPVLFATSSSVVADDDPASLRFARSNSVGGSMESFMQSLQQQQHHHHKGILMNPQPPPPVAMSLRARESASLALKHIFDQQMSNGASSRETEYNSTQGQQIGGFQGTRNQSMPDLRKRVPELDLSFRKAQDTNSAYAQTGFGSPISSAKPTDQTLLSYGPLPTNSQLVPHNIMPQAVASARLSPSRRQPTAQMTIFYSGNVNVYDDVPADKAHAIMLLAGNSLSSNFRCPAMLATPPSPQTELMAAKERASSPLKAAPSQKQASASTSTKNNSIGGNIARNISTLTPAVSTVAMSVASPPPSPVPATLSDVNTAQAGVPARRPHAGIELPHARKASLARFLEKRKDRVVQQVNQDHQEGEVGEKGGGEGGGSANWSGKPDHDPSTPSSSKKQHTRSRSPSPPRNVGSTGNNRDNSAATNRNSNEDNECPSQKSILNEHSFFH